MTSTVKKGIINHRRVKGNLLCTFCSCKQINIRECFSALIRADLHVQGCCSWHQGNVEENCFNLDTQKYVCCALNVDPE